ncbi:MAG: HAMP domain-containing histidine kinase [Anaerolineales bacterium]|nr:HAMP domain-containing histidine kinase [Anaerolineales bacterium]
MRSISLKITLVLIVVSLVGAIFTAFYIQNRTKNALDTFIRDQDQGVLIEALTNHYQENNSWEGVEQVFKGDTLYGSGNDGFAGQRENNPNRGFDRASIPFVLTTDTGLVLAGGTGHPGYQPGDTIPIKELEKGLSLESEGESIGWLVMVPFSQPRNNPQLNFLDTIREGLLISSLVTLLIALFLGGILIQSFTRPIRKLAQATEAVATGELGYQVDIKSGDELGRLAASFNSMSADLESADRSRKQITADIAHDLRTPLSVLHGYTEAMSEGKLSGNPDVYRVMHHQAQHLNYLIEDLRTLSLLDSGELSFHIQNIDPAIILEQIKAAFSPIAKEKEIDLPLEIRQDLPRVDLDPDRLTQILGNLLNNAIQVLSIGGEVTLSAETDKESLVIQVSDNGPGIQPEDLHHIFDRFYRTDESRQSDEGSSGLGLSITKKLVEAQGGIITVESEPGLGTKFSLTFPLD